MKNKILLVALAVVIFLAGLVGGYFYFKNKKGDLKNDRGKKKEVSKSADFLPFGFSGKYDLGYSELGFVSLRLGGPFGSIIWERGFDETDEMLKEISDAGYEIISGIQGGNPAADNKLEEYAAFVKSAVERYDGDGVNDAPGSPKVAYWEIDNEIDLNNGQKDPWEGWNIQKNAEKKEGEAYEYALTLKTAYQAIKSADPDAKVAIGAVGISLEYYDKVIQNLKDLKDSPSDKFFDVFNYHNYGEYDNYGRTGAPSDKMQGGPSLAEVKAFLEKYGYGDMEIIITETGTFSGTASFGGTQTEKEMAENLIKRFVYPLSEGVTRVYWFNIENIGNNIFDKMALVENGDKKLAYYSYELLADKLEGSDWSNVETVINGTDNVYVYKFTKEEDQTPVYVAWRDYFNEKTKSKTVTLDIGDIKEAKITEAVPKYESGKEVTSYSQSFNSQTKTAVDGKIEITLGKNPVFIENEQSSVELKDGSGGNGKKDSFVPIPEQPQNGIKPPIFPNGIQTDKCGDGTCDSIEKSKGVCPEDCE